MMIAIIGRLSSYVKQGRAGMGSSLDGRHIVVTGGCGDIGRAMALEMVDRGANVTVFDIQEPGGEDDAFLRSVDEGTIAFERVDVTDRESVRSTLRRIAPFDAVVGNAGISQSAPFLEITDEQWRRHQDVNLMGNFYLGQETARIMKERGTGGAIIFTGSWVQDVPWPEIAAYSASKAGLAMMMKTMALELAPHRIRVNVIAPGIVAAGMAKYQMDHEPQYARRVASIIPLGRMQTPQDVARATAFLCSDDAGYMTGTTLLVDGGCSLFQFES
jgi:NAD(P)-dependent dehydrogenase (short-subunit alcohol dehydrogenase family)